MVWIETVDFQHLVAPFIKLAQELKSGTVETVGYVRDDMNKIILSKAGREKVDLVKTACLTGLKCAGLPRCCAFCCAGEEESIPLLTLHFLVMLRSL